VHGLFALESARERDFRPADVERIASALAHERFAWRAAQFRAWHLARFGEEAHFDPCARAWRERKDDLWSAARSPSPVAVVGGEGAGKQVLARWIHFEGSDPEARLVCRRTAVADEQPPTAGSWIIDDFDTLADGRQVQLLQVLAEPRGCARPIALVRRPLREAVLSGALRADLAARFEPLELFVPALRDRRDEIPALARVLALRAARREGLPPPVFADATLALLWRQAWEGNVRELESLVHRLVLVHPGEELGPETVVAVARRFRRPLRQRMPSRRPRSADLLAALETTARANGAWNKTRAALYLGWDPDTLAARLRERGQG
jgi:DNA-binding NtrC family response regulator